MLSIYKRALSMILAVTLVSPGIVSAGTAAASDPSGRASAYSVEASLPNAAWQMQIAFPDGYGYVDDTLAMNSLASFTNFRDQGALYIRRARRDELPHVRQ